MPGERPILPLPIIPIFMVYKAFYNIRQTGLYRCLIEGITDKGLYYVNQNSVMVEEAINAKKSPRF